MIFGFSGYKVPSLRSRPSNLAILLSAIRKSFVFIHLNLLIKTFLGVNKVYCICLLLTSWNRKQIGLMYCNLRATIQAVQCVCLLNLLNYSPATSIEKRNMLKNSCADAVRIQNVRYLIGLQPGTPKSS